MAGMQNYEVTGLPQFRNMVESLRGPELDKAILDMLDRIGEPTRMRLLTHYDSFRGKHDNESLAQALTHRWWNRRRRQGLPVGYTRALALKALVTDGFGFKVAKLKKAAGYLLRIKAWGPGIFLTEHGRYKSKGAYAGWKRAKPILKRFAATAASALNRELPKTLEQVRAKAAGRNGIR